MSREAAKAFYDRQPGDPDTGYVTPARAQAAIGQIYDDMTAAGVTTTTSPIQEVTVPTPAGRSIVAVTASVDGGSLYGLGAAGYQTVVVGAEIKAANRIAIVRYGVGAGKSPEAYPVAVHWVVTFRG